MAKIVKNYYKYLKINILMTISVFMNDKKNLSQSTKYQDCILKYLELFSSRKGIPPFSCS